MSGLYKKISDHVKETNYNKAVINADELIGNLCTHIDLSEIPDEEKDRFIIGCMARVVLNSLGYRALIRRKRVYVNPELMDSADLTEIIGNIDEDINAFMAIKGKLQELKNNCDGQFYFNEDMKYSEEMTTEELFEALIKKYAI